MVKVVYEADENHYLTLEVSGHAEAGEYGNDLICASVSSIVFGLMNALDALEKEIDIEVYENLISIDIHEVSDITDNYMELVMIQLKTIEESYGDFIKVERK
ncbi:MAG: ribosomal-processing cysteine protease Prp [Erysipelotrichaceae bacterium]|nr:ribosomal-processing cysteine protease Prp [Erysipelotrichaceae bacterium]